MELPNPISWGFCSSSRNIVLLLLVAILTFSVIHASATSKFQNETDLRALLEFKRQISDDPYGLMDSWDHTQHHCQWQGVRCDTRHQRVTALTLVGKSMSGSISPHIGNLSFMKFINLANNQLLGEIPQEVGHLFRLRYLNLSSNKLSGEIPVDLSNCSKLITISLSNNKLEGRIPSRLRNLKKLEIVHLGMNNLTGEIPSSIGNLSLLTEITVSYNNLEGSLPKEIGFLTSLTRLGVGANKLSGMFPASINNISSIVLIAAAFNSFHGRLPTSIGLSLPNLQRLEFAVNKFQGNIPVSITNASRLEVLDLSDNNFEGQVPINFGSLSNLQLLNFEINLLGSSSSRDLDFVASLTNISHLSTVGLDDNNFGGEIPKVTANLTYELKELFLGGNRLSGAIPEGLGNLVNLYMFDVTGNSLSGVIPSDFSKLPNLQSLGLGGNKLSGEIFSILYNITTLYHVNLEANNFNGSLSGNLGNYKILQFLDVSNNNLSGIISPLIFTKHLSLVYLDLSYNSFSGSIPLEVGKLIHLEVFNVSHNNFSGKIPTSLVDCLSLEHLHMQNNFFQGIIPSNLAFWKSIQEIDLSSNNLTGHVPRDLEKLQYLRYLNLSYNDLDGEIPTTGIFGNESQISLTGNNKICGGIPELGLPSCHVIKGNNKGKLKVILLSTVLPVIGLLLGTLIYYSVVYRKRHQRMVSISTMPMKVGKHIRISFHELHRATSGFSLENLIGSGSFGFVYKGRINHDGERLVAVKVLDLQKNGASKSFKAECKALRNIRHRNLVPILSYCSSIDSKGLEFKALVYEFMENGSLDSWLHPEITDQTTSPRNLNLLQRLNIAIDVASVLYYLHNHSETTVVHCDLKPSNILLDKDLVAHVGDFGLARLLPKTINSISSEPGTSSTIAIKGSIGYAAPEYGMGLGASTQGDVYSYGILLLEMITGRRPTDDMFMDGLDLYNYVSMALPEQLFKIVDPFLLVIGDETRDTAAGEQVNNGERKMECLISLLKIGLHCSPRLPNDRMHMNEVMRKLLLIKDGFLGVNIHKK